MGLSLLAGIALPLGLFLFLRKRYHCAAAPFWTGCLIFLLFALVLEAAVHRLVLGSSAGGAIRESALLYALYGGLMAGLFEETGRLVAFSLLVKKHRGNDGNALMYGAGHGGFEAFMILGLGMVGNLALSLLVRGGYGALFAESLSGEALEQLEAAVATLSSTAPTAFLAGIAERISAVALHLSLSVLVWFAVKRRKWLLYPLAILLHAGVDGAVVLLSRGGVSLWAVEGIIALFAAACAVIALAVWRANAAPPPQEEVPS